MCIVYQILISSGSAWKRCDGWTIVNCTCKK